MEERKYTSNKGQREDEMNKVKNRYCAYGNLKSTYQLFHIEKPNHHVLMTANNTINSLRNPVNQDRDIYTSHEENRSISNISSTSCGSSQNTSKIKQHDDVCSDRNPVKIPN